MDEVERMFNQNLKIGKGSLPLSAINSSNLQANKSSAMPNMSYFSNSIRYNEGKQDYNKNASSVTGKDYQQTKTDPYQAVKN